VLYRIEWLPAARRQLRKLPRSAAERVFSLVGSLAENPRPTGCRKLSGHDARFRVRLGDYRAIYEVRDEVLVVIVVTVGHRREVYRLGEISSIWGRDAHRLVQGGSSESAFE
jgi:mRNA interferase RelE/StbE